MNPDSWPEEPNIEPHLWHGTESVGGEGCGYPQ